MQRRSGFSLGTTPPSQRKRGKSASSSPVSENCRLVTDGSTVCSGGETRFGFFRQSAKSHLITDRQVRQYFTVDLDGRLFQAVDHTAVGQAVDAGRGVDAHDPQTTELTLAYLTVTVGVLTGLDNRLHRHAEHAAAGTVVTFCLLENFLVPATRLHTTLDSSHCSDLQKPVFRRRASCV